MTSRLSLPKGGSQPSRSLDAVKRNAKYLSRPRDRNVRKPRPTPTFTLYKPQDNLATIDNEYASAMDIAYSTSDWSHSDSEASEDSWSECYGSIMTESTAPVTSNDSGSWSIPQKNSSDSLMVVKLDSAEATNTSQHDEGSESRALHENCSVDTYFTAQSSPVYGIRRTQVVVPIRSSSGSELDQSSIQSNDDVHSILVARMEEAESCTDPDDDDEDVFSGIEGTVVEAISKEVSHPFLNEAINRNDTKVHHAVEANIVEHEIINLLEPQPEAVFASLIDRSHRMLCQMAMSSEHLRFLSPTIAPAESTLKPPFIMFPNKTTVLVARDRRNDTYSLTSKGPILGGILTHLLDLQGSLSKKPLTIQAFAYRDVIPAIVEKRPFSVDSSLFRVKLDAWKHSLELQRNSTENILGPSASTEANRADDALTSGKSKYIKCDPDQLKTLVSNDAELDKDMGLLSDDELRAVFELTDEGNDARSLFPAFSDETASLCMSDDGLRDEMGALNTIEDNLRKELERAERIVAGVASQVQSSSTTENEAAQRANEKLAKLEQIEKDLRSALARADAIISQVNSEDEDDVDQRGLKPQDQLEMKKKPKSFKVRFDDNVQEHLFVSEAPVASIDDEVEEDKFEKDASRPRIFTSIGILYAAVEKVVEEMGNSCVTVFEKPEAYMATSPINVPYDPSIPHSSPETEKTLRRSAF